MKICVKLLFLVCSAGMTILSGCTDPTIEDTTTEKRISVIQNPAPSLTKLKVQTDGMVADLGYEGRHPLGMGQEVFVDMGYYETHDVSRGDIVVFAIKEPTEFQDTDIARVVGLPGESVSIDEGQVYINKNKLDAFYGDDSTFDNNYSLEQPLALNDNEYYILADVRWRGFHDSQMNGPFMKEDILGKVVGYENNQ